MFWEWVGSPSETPVLNTSPNPLGLSLHIFITMLITLDFEKRRIIYFFRLYSTLRPQTVFKSRNISHMVLPYHIKAKGCHHWSLMKQTDKYFIILIIINRPPKWFFLLFFNIVLCLLLFLFRFLCLSFILFMPSNPQFGGEFNILLILN